MKKITLLFGFVLAVNLCFAQKIKPEWAINLFAVADNREYEKAQHQVPQSILGTWLAPEVGLNFDSVHHVRAGVSLLRNYGSHKQSLDQVQYVAYYHYNFAPFELYVGNFPSRTLLSDYPAAMLYDSITDMRPNMGGIFWKIFGARWNVNAWLDWAGHRTEEHREIFLAGIAGKYQIGKFYTSTQTYMNHYANSKNDANQHIVDNGMARLCVGLSFPGNSIIDSLNINAGALAAYSRERSVDEKYSKSIGFISEVLVEKFGIGVKNTLYAGDNQMPLYNRYGGEPLYWGDPFYQNTFYNRTDFYIQVFDTNRIQARFTWSMHAAESLLSHQQMFTLNVSLNSFQKKSLRANRKTLAGLFR